jgi:hypothetical protein
MVREHFGADPEFTGNVATRHGQAHEADALAAFERVAGVMTHGGQEFCIHADHDFLGVTPDALIGASECVEIKCPYGAPYTASEAARRYADQVQLQMACLGADLCTVVVYYPAGKHAQAAIDAGIGSKHDDGSVLDWCAVPRDRDWLRASLPALHAFMDRYREAIKSPDAYITNGEREDGDWQHAARMWQTAKADMERAKALMDEWAQALRELAGDKPAKGCGVQIVVSERKGSIDYKRALADLAPDADLSPYAGQASTVVSLREYKGKAK